MYFLPGCSKQFLPAVDMVRVRGILPGEELGHRPGRELRLTGVAEVPRQVDRLALHQGGEQRHVAGFPAAGRQGETQPVQLVPQLLPAVLRLCPGLFVLSGQ